MLDYSLDDSSGESLGDGLDSSALDLSGSSMFDDTSEPLQGSGLTLDDQYAPSVTDPLSDYQDASLTGISDPIQDSEGWDTGNSDTNGAGSAPSSHPYDVSSPDDVSGMFSAVGKFGASIGQLFMSGSASSAPRVGGPLMNVNPNRTISHSIASSHAFLMVGIVVVVGAAIVFGGK